MSASNNLIQTELDNALIKLGEKQALIDHERAKCAKLERKVNLLNNVIAERQLAIKKRDVLARVVRAEVRYSEKNQPFAVYVILVIIGKHRFESVRRYREFASLDARLRQVFPEMPVPDMPPKSSLYSLVTGKSAEQLLPEKLDARRRGLNDYVVGLCQVPVLRDCTEFHIFLDLHSHLDSAMQQYDTARQNVASVDADALLADVDRLEAAQRVSLAQQARDDAMLRAVTTAAIAAHRRTALQINEFVDKLAHEMSAQCDAVTAKEASVESVKQLSQQLLVLKTHVEKYQKECDEALNPKKLGF